MSRSPHGERGLKYVNADIALRTALSLPPRGAWIKIFFRRYPELAQRRPAGPAHRNRLTHGFQNICVRQQPCPPSLAKAPREKFAGYLCHDPILERKSVKGCKNPSQGLY